MRDDVRTKPAGGLWGKTPASRQRREEIVAAAKTVFFQEGYQLATMERLAAVAGTTKRTLYDHFGSKEALFAASIEYGCQLFVGNLPSADDLPTDTQAALTLFVGRMALLLNGPEVIRFLRMVIAEAERHPAFAKILDDAAFTTAEHILRDYLLHQVAVGKLKPHDAAAWARTLVGLAANLQHVRALLAVPGQPATLDEDARAQIVAMYVQTYTVDTA